jgi:ABC-type multidrug transport system fused ATPase/permease subunit
MRTFWRITAFLADYKLLVVVAFGAALGQMALSLTIPLFTRAVINDALVGGDYGLLLPLGLAIVGVGVARFAVAVVRRYATGHMSLGIEFTLRNRLYWHLLQQPAGYFDRWQTGQLMSRAMSDIQNVRMFLGYGLVFFTTNVFTLAAVTVLLFVLDWSLALLSLAFLPLLLVVALRFSRRLHPVLRDVQQKIADVTTAAEENVTGSRIVKIFAREDDELEKFSARSRAVFDASISAARLRAFYVPLIGFLPNIAVAALLYFGARDVIDGSLSLGSLVAFYTYLMMLIYPAQVLGWLTGLMQRAIASGERVYEILDTPLQMTDAPDAQPLVDVCGAVRLEDVRFAYAVAGDGVAAAGSSDVWRRGDALGDGDTKGGAHAAGAVTGSPLAGETAAVERHVLRGIDLDVPCGATIALVGHTGCGKTTLTNLIPRFYDVTGGTVLVDGHDVRSVTRESLRRHIGIVNQDPYLFSTTVAENIRFGAPEASDEEVREAACRAQADEFIATLPQGYDTVIGERGYTLSGGQRQRIAIARALVMNPRILILDDATSSVDTATEYRIRQALMEVMRDRTTFIIAHRPSTIALAREVVVLDEGRIEERGGHDELMAAGGLYARMFGAAEAEGRTLDLAGTSDDGGPHLLRGPVEAAWARDDEPRDAGKGGGASRAGNVTEALLHEERESEGALSPQQEVERGVRDGGR